MESTATTPVELTRAEIVMLIEVLHPRMLERVRAAPMVDTVTPLPESTLLVKLHDAKDRFIHPRKTHAKV